MARSSARFVIKEAFQGPQSRAFAMNLLTAEQWGQLEEARNVVRVDIDPTETEPRTQAIMLGWKYGTGDTRLSDWHVRPREDEQAYANAAAATLRAERLIVEGRIEAAKAAKPPRAPAESDLQRLSELLADEASLSSYCMWTEVLNSFGDGAMALYRACNAPNIPFAIRSNWRLEADRPFTVWIHRCKPHEAQEFSRVRIRFGCYCLELRQESEVHLYRYKHGRFYEDDPEQPGMGQGKWVEYDGTDWARIEAIEAQIDAIRDRARLTAAEREQIAAWEVELAELKALAKRSRETWSDHQKAQNEIQQAAIRQRIEDLKAAKRRLTLAEETQIEQLEDEYLADDTEVQFMHMAESLLGTDLALTFIPQPRGFLVLHTSQGKDYFVYEDTDITDSREDGQIIAATPIEISGNGGAIWCKFAYIEPEATGYLLSGPRLRPQKTTGEPLPLGSMQLAVDGLAMPGTRAAGRLQAEGADLFRYRVDFSSTGGYLPFVYRLVLEVPASARDRDKEVVLHDSRTMGVSWNVGSSYSRENRGRAATLTFDLVPRTIAYNYLELLAEKQIVFYEDNAPWFTGILREPEVVILGPGLRRITYQCFDRWYIMRGDRIASEPAGDRKTLGAYFRQVARGLGLWDDEIIVTGVWPQRVLPHSRPGERPAIAAEYDERRADYLERLFEDFGIRCAMWFDGRGRLHLEPQGTVTKPLSYHLESTGPDDRCVMQDVTITQDWEEFANDVTVQGRRVRGYPLSRRCLDWTSVLNPDHPYYIGRWIRADTHQSDHLQTEADVNLAARWRLEQYKRPYTEVEFTTGYNAALEIGDRVTVTGATAEVIELRSDARHESRMRMKVRII